MQQDEHKIKRSNAFWTEISKELSSFECINRMIVQISSIRKKILYLQKIITITTVQIFMRQFEIVRLTW